MKKRGKKRTARKGRRRIVSGLSRATLQGLQGVSRGDFAAIAKVLCETGASSGTTDGIARYFGSKNPRFDQDRFVRAATTCRK